MCFTEAIRVIVAITADPQGCVGGRACFLNALIGTSEARCSSRHGELASLDLIMVTRKIFYFFPRNRIRLNGYLYIAWGSIIFGYNTWELPSSVRSLSSLDTSGSSWEARSPRSIPTLLAMRATSLTDTFSVLQEAHDWAMLLHTLSGRPHPAPTQAILGCPVGEVGSHRFVCT